jgi:hypothetical protein
MNKRIISNEEFIELWNTHKSAAKIAKLTGISERNVHHRRRDIEAKHDTVLVAASNKNSVAQAYGHINLGMENGTVIVFSDAHFQLGRRTTAFKALLWLIGELKPKVVVNNGDAFDGAQASRHPVNGWDVTPTIIQELNACKMFLGEIQEAAGDAKLIWTLGNHDARFSTRLATVAPEFQGVEGFRLEDHFPDWQHVVSCMVNDKLMVKHRWKGGIHATHNNAVGSGVSFCTGHLHSAKVTPWTDYTGTRYGVDCGTLAEAWGDQFAYGENSPKNHRSAFAVLNIVGGHLLMPELCMVSALADDCVEWRGELIDVSEF